MCGISLTYDLDGEQTNNFMVTQGLESVKYLRKRGNDGFGLVFLFEDGEIKRHVVKKDIDKLAYEVVDYRKDTSKKILAVAGHDRYATSGDYQEEISVDSSQPIIIDVELPNKETYEGVFLFNGNKWNAEEYATEHDFFAKYNISKPVLDTDVIKCCIKEYVKKEKGNHTLESLLCYINSELKGACAGIFFDENGVIVGTDEEGKRLLPFSHNKEKGIFVVSSESSYIENIMSATTAQAMQVLKKGECVEIIRKKLYTDKGIYTKSEISVSDVRQYIGESVQANICGFEPLYMMLPGSLNSYKVRQLTGKKLAEIETEDIDPDKCIALYAPNTARDVAVGFANELGIKMNANIITKNSDDRVFLEQIDKRWDKMKVIFEINWGALEKLFKDKPDLEKIFLLDDTIVNGLTSKFLVQLIKKGCKERFGRDIEVHLRIGAHTISEDCRNGAVMNAERLIIQEYCKDPNNPTDTEIDTMSEEYFESKTLKFLSFDMVESIIIEHIYNEGFYEPEEEISLCRECHDGTCATKKILKNIPA